MTGTEFDYELLGDEQRRQIIDSRLAQYEAEHYGNVLNRMTLERASDVSEDEKGRQLAQMDRVIASLESSIELHRAERARLGASNGGTAA